MAMSLHTLEDILGINRRNIEFIMKHNPRKAYRFIDNKVMTKELLEKAGVPCPGTIAVIRSFFEIDAVLAQLRREKAFVIKPANGRGGSGILIIETNESGRFFNSAGEAVSEEFFTRRCGDILFGVYSMGKSDDAVLVEKRINQHEDISRIYSRGIADIRIILFRGHPVMSMLRIPTDRSGGRANLHQGAMGAGIDPETGTTISGFYNGRETKVHPDTGVTVSGIVLPFWKTVMEYALKAAACMPLKYIGVDIIIDRDRGPLMVEVNARPGLQIQMINRTGLLPGLKRAGTGGL